MKDGTKYTYADYARWDGENRWELIDGVPYMMSPAPSTEHQRISRKLLVQIDRYLNRKSCEVFAAPFDVRLNAEMGDDTVVQPDLSIICDPNKIDEHGCKGAPDMVVEILSPSTQKMDQGIKLIKYLEAGVREYWIVDQENRKLFVYILKGSDYIIKTYDETDQVSINIFDDCVVNMAEVFPIVAETTTSDLDTSVTANTQK